MVRPIFASILLGLVVGLVLLAPGAAPVQGAKVADLQDRLEKGLKARRPAEFNFVARVVRQVERDRLPRKIVDSTYLWAVRQPAHPFQHFERAMRVQAARLGIKL